MLHDTITVSVSPQHHVLVVKGYSGSEYQPILGFLNVGDFHSAEPWLYEECLRENIRARVEAYYNITDRQRQHHRQQRHGTVTVSLEPFYGRTCRTLTSIGH